MRNGGGIHTHRHICACTHTYTEAGRQADAHVDIHSIRLQLISGVCQSVIYPTITHTHRHTQRQAGRQADKHTQVGRYTQTYVWRETRLHPPHRHYVIHPPTHTECVQQMAQCKMIDLPEQPLFVTQYLRTSLSHQNYT